MHFEHILVTTDLSSESTAAFTLPSYDRKMEGTKVTVLTVVENWQTPLAVEEYVPDPETLIRFRHDLVEGAKKKLDELCNGQFSDQSITKEVVLSDLSTGEAICDYATSHGCGLIVMCSHGRGVLGNLFLGSVVQKVIRLSSCPVLVVPRNRA